MEKSAAVRRYWFLDEAGIFLVYSIIFGIFLAFIVPPLQAPDEIVHFSRAYSVSNLQFFPDKQDGTSASAIPKSFYELEKSFITLHHHKYIKADMRQLSEVFKARLNPDEHFYRLTTVPEYCPTNYIFPALGVGLGRIFGLSPVLLMYFGRLFNLAAWILIVYLAIRITPLYKAVFLVVSILPIKLYLAASLSTDAFANAITTIFIALVLKYAFEKDSLCKMDIFLLGLISVLMLTAKGGIYFLLILLVFLIPQRKIRNNIRSPHSLILFFLIVILISLYFFYLTFNFTSWEDPISLNKTSTHLRELLNGHYLSVLKNTLIRKYDELFFHGGVGILGWLDTYLPSWMVTCYAALVLGVAIFDHREPISIKFHEKAWIALIVLLNVNLVFFSVWFFNNDKAGKIIGIQGRYFSPLLLPFMLLFYNNKLKLPKKIFYYAISVFLLILLFVVSMVVLQRYWV